MRRAAFLTLALLAAGGQAPPVPPPVPLPDSWVPRDTAELRVLDKVSAKSTPLTLRAGQEAENASLSIALRACAARPPDMAQDSAAFLDIRDSHPGVPGFHGWVFSNEPAVSLFEHPIYDVRLLGCH